MLQISYKVKSRISSKESLLLAPTQKSLFLLLAASRDARNSTELLCFYT